MKDNRRRHRMMESALLIVLAIAVLCVTFAVLAVTMIDWNGIATTTLKSIKTSYKMLSDFSVTFFVTLAFSVAITFLVRIVAESVYIIARIPHRTSQGLAYVVMAVVASTLVAGLSSFFVIFASSKILLALGCLITSVIILALVNRKVDFMSLSVDATRSGLIPTTTYGSSKIVVVPYGVLPAYRKARKEVRLMQSIGVGTDGCLVIGNAGELLMVADALPSDSPLAMFLTGTGPNVFDGDRRFPFGVGRLVDATRNYFVTFDSKQLSKRNKNMLMTAEDFVRVRAEFAGTFADSVVVRGTRNGDVRISRLHDDKRTRKNDRVTVTNASVQDKTVLATPTPDTTGNMLIDIDDGMVGDGTISAVVPPDKSGIIPITDESVVPIIQSESEDETLVDSGIGDIVGEVDE